MAIVPNNPARRVMMLLESEPRQNAGSRIHPVRIGEAAEDTAGELITSARPVCGSTRPGTHPGSNPGRQS